MGGNKNFRKLITEKIDKLTSKFQTLEERHGNENFRKLTTDKFSESTNKCQSLEKCQETKDA